MREREKEQWNGNQLQKSDEIWVMSCENETVDKDQESDEKKYGFFVTTFWDHYNKSISNHTK